MTTEEVKSLRINAQAVQVHLSYADPEERATAKFQSIERLANRVIELCRSHDKSPE